MNAVSDATEAAQGLPAGTPMIVTSDSNAFGITTPPWQAPNKQGFDRNGNYYNSDYTSSGTNDRIARTPIVNNGGSFPIGPIPAKDGQVGGSGTHPTRNPPNWPAAAVSFGGGSGPDGAPASGIRHFQASQACIDRNVEAYSHASYPFGQSCAWRFRAASDRLFPRCAFPDGTLEWPLPPGFPPRWLVAPARWPAAGVTAI